MKKRVFILIFCLTFLNCLDLQAQDTLHFDRYRDFVNYVTHVFKDNHSDLSFFKYRLIRTPVNSYDIYKGEGLGQDSTCDFLRFGVLIKDLEISNYNENHPTINLSNYDHQLLKQQTNVAPIGLAFIEYGEFKDSTIVFNYIGWNNNQFTESSPNGYYPFKKSRLFASSALTTVVYESPIQYTIDDSLIFSNIPSGYDSIFVDFADGNGFVPVEKSMTYSVSYPSDGIKTLQVKIKTDTSYMFSSFNIIDSTHTYGNRFGSNSNSSSCNNNIQLPDLMPVSISTVGPFGTTVAGKYAVWYATCAQPETFLKPTRLRKPYIVVAGFNPGNGKQLLPGLLAGTPTSLSIFGVPIYLPPYHWNGEWRGTYYETFNGSFNKRFDEYDFNNCHSGFIGPLEQGGDDGNEYLDRLRDEGYDVVILSFDNGKDFTANNAALIKALIVKINLEKFNNGFFFENILSGYSAGAVASRLALAEMESAFKNASGPHPHTKMWISMDGEHQASNVPLGLQFLLDFQSDPNNQMPTMYGLNIQQALADDINRHVASLARGSVTATTAQELMAFTSGSPNGPNSLRSGLLHTLSTINGNTSRGYPEFCRLVGVSQGSSKGTTTPHSSNLIFDSQLDFAPFGWSSSPQVDECGNTYVMHVPFVRKKLTARWWSANNSGGNVFDGTVVLDKSWTWSAPICVSGCFCCGCCCGFRFDYCSCVQFEWTGAYVSIGQHNPTPTAATNFDDAPGSTLTSHIELYKESAFPFYNNSFASLGGNSYANFDPNLHSFTPTTSALDLRDPSTGDPVSPFIDPVSLNLMFNSVDNTTGIPVQQSNRRFGFPFLKNSNPRSITPFDAVYAVGDNNGTFGNGAAVPDNQIHDENSQPAIGDYLSRVEVAPEDLFLSNRQVGSTLLVPCLTPGCYTAEFEARNSITVGNGIYNLDPGNPTWFQNNLTPDGNFEVVKGAKIILHSANVVGLLPGTHITSGGEMDVFIKGYNCPNDLFRNSNHGQGGSANNGGFSSNSNALANQTLQPARNAISAQKNINIKVYPNPTSGIVRIDRETEDEATVTLSDLNGKTIYSSTIVGSGTNNIDVSTVQNGIYLLQVGSSKFRLMIFK